MEASCSLPARYTKPLARRRVERGLKAVLLARELKRLPSKGAGVFVHAFQHIIYAKIVPLVNAHLTSAFMGSPHLPRPFPSHEK